MCVSSESVHLSREMTFWRYEDDSKESPIVHQWGRYSRTQTVNFLVLFSLSFSSLQIYIDWHWLICETKEIFHKKFFFDRLQKNPQERATCRYRNIKSDFWHVQPAKELLALKQPSHNCCVFFSRVSLFFFTEFGIFFYKFISRFVSE